MCLRASAEQTDVCVASLWTSQETTENQPNTTAADIKD